MQSRIRNFAIIAHIDHGKSTLSDRIIQLCGGVEEREMKEQLLDSMDIERERGITVKAQSVALEHVHSITGKRYRFNFIDTPGHIDFSYEVSRSMAACEAALLVVDASQGVEAQTVAHCYSAIDEQLSVLPVLNKIDLPVADPERVRKEIEDAIGIDASNALCVSAKTGTGIRDLLDELIDFVPPPDGKVEGATRALVIDSWFDSYLGVVSLVRVIDGVLQKGQRIRLLSTAREYEIGQVGQFTPKTTPRDQLTTGEIGYVIAGIKDIHGIPVGDTLTDAAKPCSEPIAGFKKIQPRVFAGLYPVSNKDFSALYEALEKLRLNDSALQYEAETSNALGFGFRVGFLGMLHMEIVSERLRREYDLSLIATSPSVEHQVILPDGTSVKVENPAQMPSPDRCKTILEPCVEANIYVPGEYIGSIISLCIEKRGVQKNLSYIGEQAHMVWSLPLGEIITDFFERLKSCSRGLASMDYTVGGYVPADLVKLDILINGERVDAFAFLIHRDAAQKQGRKIIERLRESIPRQMFEVALQAAVGAKIIARTNIRALRKNVTAKCYGGDVSRKRKLLEKQKKGKKRMRSIGRVDIPQEAFLSVLERG